MTKDELFRGVDDRPNPHVKWLREVASNLHAERRTAMANTCEQAAKELESVLAHRNALLIAHEHRSVEPAAPQKCWLCGEDGSQPCQYGYDTDKGCIRVKRCALKQPADRKSALDEIVRISEEAGLYDPTCAHSDMERVDGHICTSCGGYRSLDEPDAPLRHLNRTTDP